MRLESKCEQCGHVLTEISRTAFGINDLVTFKCGHARIEERKEAKKYTTCIDGTKLYPFQTENIENAAGAKFRCLINDDTGLGKTLSAGGILAAYREELLPALAIVRASTKSQWLVELYRRFGLLSQMLENGQDEPVPGFDVTICSYDSLRNAKWFDKFKFKCVILDECQAIKNHDSKRTQAVRELIRTLNTNKVKRSFTPNLKQRARVETMARDLMAYHGVAGRFKLYFDDIGSDKLGLCECQAEKDGRITGRITINKEHAEQDNENEVLETILHEIAHAITVGGGHRPIWRDTALAIGSNGQAVAWCEGTHEIRDEFYKPIGVIALSATPVMNNEAEHFPVLNILRPELFPTRDYFIRRYVDTYAQGMYVKLGGLKRNTDFFEKTKPFIFRHRREEVLAELPSLRRGNRFYPIGDEVRDAYVATMQKFADYCDKEKAYNEAKNQQHVLAFLNKMRHLTGLAKVQPVFDFAQEFLESCDRKLTIFHHHHDVGDLIMALFREAGIEPLRFWADDPERMDKTARCATYHWPSTDPKDRVLIASIGASGEGLNLQACSDAIIVERQWNPAREEQAEGRFPRPGSIAQFVDVTYPTVLNSIDEFFAEIVERKRQYVAQSRGDAHVQWDESSMIKELVERINTEGRKKWGVH